MFFDVLWPSSTRIIPTRQRGGSRCSFKLLLLVEIIHSSRLSPLPSVFVFAMRYRRWTALQQRFILFGGVIVVSSMLSANSRTIGVVLFVEETRWMFASEGNEIHFCVMGLWSLGFGRIGCINTLVFRGFVQLARTSPCPDVWELSYVMLFEKRE